MTNLTPPSASTDNEQEELVDYILKQFGAHLIRGEWDVTPTQIAQDIANMVSLHTKEAVLKARIDERSRLIADDTDGRNAVYIAKQKQLVTHEHFFDFNSYMCSCGITRADAEELDRPDEATLADLSVPTVPKTDMEGSGE